MMSPIDRRRFLTLLSTPVVLGLLASCGSESGGTTPTTGGATPTTGGEGNGTNGADGVVRSRKPRETVCTCDASLATESVNTFGADLYRLLTVDTTPATATNLVFSPASIAIALAMTRAGAAGTTATEMDAVLHVSDPTQFPSSMNALQLGFDERNQRIDVPGTDDSAEIVLSVANSLWGQQGYAFENTFLDLLAEQYGAGVQLVDYKRDPEAARKLINSWVADNTNDRIPELLAEGVITSDARLTLVNAIFMKAPWLKPFDTSSSDDLSFTTASGDVVQAPTMLQTERFNYAAGDTWQALELPYTGSLLSMIIVLPNEGAALADGVDALATLANAAKSERVTVSLPTFDIDTQVGLAETLAALGMPSAFDPLTADFSAMSATADEPLFIGAVIHQANITVDEAGTEAAAATAVVMETTSAPGPSDGPIEFTVDRPFVFAIRDNPTGAILFLGQIADPTQRRR